MNFNFEMILFYLTLGCGLIAVFDIRVLAKKRALAGRSPEDMPLISEYARSFFPVLLLVFLLRSFLYEPFRIPSGSLKPTLLTGDFILVNKFDYGIRLPVLHKKIIPVHALRRGDIVVFRFPLNPSIDFIKRVVGLPGDHISYLHKVLYVNGQEIPQQAAGFSTDEVEGDGGFVFPVKEMQETLAGVQHHIFLNPAIPATDFRDKIVPQGEYFVMGDNRDNSDDSRDWGFVPDASVIGRASVIWMSWNAKAAHWWHRIRWERIGQVIK